MSFRHVPAGLILLSGILAPQTAEKPKFPANYDEAQVGAYTLPDPLTFSEWRESRKSAGLV